MPRKKQHTAEAVQPTEPQAETAVTEAEAIHRPAYIDGPPTRVTGEVLSTESAAESASEPGEGQGKNWGPPYKAIFTCDEKGFEMGEDRRFKQRVFKFKDKPDPEILATLKDNGFVYRAEEKAWTIHADHASRQLSDALAAEFAGESQGMNR